MAGDDIRLGRREREYLVDKEKKLNDGEFGFMFDVAVHSGTTEAGKRHRLRHQTTNHVHSQLALRYYSAPEPTGVNTATGSERTPPRRTTTKMLVTLLG